MRMARIGFLFALGILAASAQPMPWIDISGPWKMALGDDPRYARPDFDDSAWQSVTLPGKLPRSQRPVPGQFLWLRRSIDLPAGLEGRALALTLGKLTENYELFVNGERLARIGHFSREQTKLARPRTFDLPALPGPRVQIAVRADSHLWFMLSLTWTSRPDPGPYVITGTANAPRTAGDSFLRELRLSRSVDLVSGVVLLCLSLLTLLMFLYDRRQLALLWLGLHTIVISVRRLQVFLWIEPDTRAFQAIDTMFLEYVVLMEFVAAALGLRVGWLRALPWALVISFYFLRPWPGYVGQGFRVIEFAFVALLVWAAWPGVARRPGHWLIVAGSALVFLSGARVDMSRGTFLELLPGVNSWTNYATLTSIFTLAMVLLLIRQLLDDRLEKQRLAGDLEAARTVQRLLLSPSAASAGEYAVDTVYWPAQEVGGDFHWSRTAPDGSLVVVVGDVSGKGLKAAMLVSVAIGILRNEKSTSPAAILASLNDGLAGHTGGGFVTCCCARFDADDTVTVANAGHPAPYAGGHEVEVEAGLPLGVVSGVEYAEASLRLDGQFMLMSDGVVEAENAQRELFGFERTREISTKSAHEIAEAAKAWGQNDDITVVTVSRSE